MITAPLAHHAWAIPTLTAWFETEWPAHYGAGGPGSAARDLHDYAHIGSLPVGIVALRGDTLCGVAVLRADSIPSHKHLSPWVGAGLVHPSMRGQGIGRLLLGALEAQARELGFSDIYCGTSTSQSLLLRSGWRLMETILHEGESLGIFNKAPAA